MKNESQSEETQNSSAPETESDAQTKQRIAEFLNGLTSRAHHVRRQFLVFVALELACLITIIALTPALIKTDNINFFWWVALLGFLAAAVGRVVYQNIRQNAPSFVWAEVAQFGGVKALVPLFAVLQNQLSLKQRQAVHDEIILLLPQMQASDAPLMTAAIRRTLYAWLDSVCLPAPENIKFQTLAIAALKALEQAGDSSAIPYVKRITKMQSRTKGQEKVRRAAIECLPKLRAKCGDMEAAQILLRASQAGEARPDTLLRPAAGAEQTNSAELLRGADAPNMRE